MSGVAAIVLAAGSSRRMGTANKLTADVGGTPLVRIAVAAALASRADPVLVVTGHEAEAVRGALGGLDVAFVHNPDHANGLSTSLYAGLAALPDDAAGVVVLLGDMPGVDAALVDRLLAAFAAADGRAVVAAAAGGKRGNPVVWPAALFAELRAVSGDTGGRDVLLRHAADIVTVEAGATARADVDTPDDLAKARDHVMEAFHESAETHDAPYKKLAE